MRIAGNFRTPRVKIVSTYSILTGAGAFAMSYPAGHVTRADRPAESGTGGMPDPARSRWIERRAGIGFTMSTQRRASRMIPSINTGRVEIRRLTAPLMSIIWLAWAWFGSCDEKSQAAVTDRKATNSLLSDRQNETLASQDNGSGSAPPGHIRSVFPSGLRVSHRSSLRYVPNLLPVCAHLHPTLPIAPAGEFRWAERHDGKRDLYFQHAA